MKRLIPLLLLTGLLSACWPGQNGKCPYYSEEAFEDVEADLRDYYGPVVDDALEGATILCTQNIEPVEGHWRPPIGGWTLVPDKLIKLRPWPTLRMSAYAHEVVHLIKYEQYGNLDANHEDGDGPWTQEDTDFLYSIWWLW